ncbi:helix-turn-helix domain-containing protein [Oceanobacillus oncorhynchi]|uniref:helix-turn-helix domain-containing protein n=1 Tax=Oceanobacillus oncorhynchi TaxID=545501 RepID=UPI00186937B5|nr:helix-turn-helix domain-containing protein [Oceanobacillus oncorhynchi]
MIEIEKNLKNLGAIIESTRISLNLSQSELAEGICSQSQISKIESGQISPYIHTVVKLSKKLGIDPKYFLNYIYKDQYEFVAHSKESIRKAISNKDYDEVKRLVNLYEKHKEFQDLEEKQFISWHKGIISYYFNKDFYGSLKILTNALSMKHALQSTEQDIQILNSIAIIYSEEGQLLKAQDKFKEAIKIYDKSLFIIDPHIYIRICYNLSKVLYNLKEYQDGLSFCNRGIEMCKERQSNYMFGELLFQKGTILIGIMNKHEGIKYLQYAGTIFELLEREDYLSIVKRKIDKLNNNPSEVNY